MAASCSSCLSEHARPSRARANQARCCHATPAGAFTLPALSRRLRHRDFALPAADQTRDDVACGDGTRSCCLTPRTRFRRIVPTHLVHFSPSLEKQSEAGRHRRARLSSKDRCWVFIEYGQAASSDISSPSQWSCLKKHQTAQGEELPAQLLMSRVYCPKNNQLSTRGV